MVTKNYVEEIAKLKCSIQDNVAVNDAIVCGFCDELIDLAKQVHDHESIAYGYVWRADNKFYVHSDLDAMREELKKAANYINEENPSELSVKYYALMAIYYENIHDIQITLQYGFKALKAAEVLHLEDRIGIQYGNIGSYFLAYGCYEEAYLYTKKAVSYFYNHGLSNTRFLRALLYNFITIYIQLHQPWLAYAYIMKLSKLPIAPQDLDIYVNGANIAYYAYLKDKETTLYYYHKYMKNSVPNRLYEIDFLKNVFKAMMSIENKEKAKDVLYMLGEKIHHDETELYVSLIKLKIQYTKKYATNNDLQALYKTFYHYFTKSQVINASLKIKGMLNKLDLVNAHVAVNQSQKQLQIMKHTANYDGLTKVYNRHYINAKQNEIYRDKTKTPIGMVMIDVDFFKEYNDFYGHLAGDEILRQIGYCLNSNATENMVIGRYGGDEFMAICWNTTIEELLMFVTKVQKAIFSLGLEHKTSRCSQQVTLSIGYGIQSNLNDTDSIILFNNVDKAMYLAKCKGRNRAETIQ